MEKVILTILILAIFTESAICQSPESLITTEEESKEWLGKLEGIQKLSDKLIMLQNRILLDTNLFVHPSVHRVILPTDTSKIKADCRLMIVVNSKDYYFENNTDTKKIQDFTKYLTTENISSLKVYDPEKAASLYGSKGICGLIWLKTTNRKVLKKMDKIFK